MFSGGVENSHVWPESHRGPYGNSMSVEHDFGDVMGDIAKGVICIGSLGILCAYGCSGDNGNNGNGSGDAGDVGDVGDVYLDNDDDGDTIADALDVDEDGDTLPDCDDPVRDRVNDNYASLTISGQECYPTDMDIVENKIFGVCDYPINKVFACEIHADTGACQYVTNLSLFSEADGLPMHPSQITYLGNGRMLVLANTEKTESNSDNDIYLLDASDLDAYDFPILQRFSIPSMEIGSGSSTISVVPRGLHSAVLLDGAEHLFISSRNYNATTGKYEPGFVIDVPFMPPPASLIDEDRFSQSSLFFAVGRNTQAMAAIDTSTIAILNAFGSSAEIPSELGPGEIAEAVIHAWDFSTAETPTISRTAEMGGVEIKNLPEMIMVDGGQRAIVGSTDIPPIVHNVNLGSSPSVSQVTLPATAIGEISALAYSSVADKVLVSLSDGYLYRINLSAMSVDSESIYLGYEPLASVISSDGNTLYQAVERPCGVTMDDPYIISVDVSDL